MRLKIRDIKRGDVFYEFEYGQGLKVEAIEDAHENDGMWQVTAKNVFSGELHGFSHNLRADPNEVYAPNIYDHEAYIGGGKFIGQSEEESA